MTEAEIKLNAVVRDSGGVLKGFQILQDQQQFVLMFANGSQFPIGFHAAATLPHSTICEWVRVTWQEMSK